MRILHTGDWHLGNSIHEVDRTEEQAAFLEWLVEIINLEKVEALIVAGDIFDTHNPPVKAQKIYYSFLASLINTCCGNVVIIGGNHDSGKLLDAPKTLLDALNINVVGRIDDRSVEEMIFALTDKDGSEKVICAAVPFLSDVELKNRYDIADAEEGKFSDYAYSHIYDEFLEKAKKLRGERELPIIAMGHLYAAGLEGRYAQYENEEEEIKTDDRVQKLDVVGNLGKVHSDSFSRDYDYVALGHIHYTSRVGGEDRIMYSGSPFVMGYDDSFVNHHVLLVDIGEGDDPCELKKPRWISVPKWNRFERVEGSRDEIMDKLKDIVSSESLNISSKNPSDNSYDSKSIPLYIELKYHAEDGSFLESAVEGLELPDHVKIISWNMIKKENVGVDSFEGESIKSMKSLKPEIVVRELILNKLPLSEEEKKDKSEEDIKNLQDELVNKYLPYFLEAFEEVEIEMKNEQE